MPHDFILNYLYPLETNVIKMFGNYAIYVGGKIFLAIRNHQRNPLDNGIWIGTSLNAHESLKAEFPSLTNLKLHKIKKWLLLPIEAEDFEKTAITICELIKKGDPRIGVIPHTR